MLTTLEHVRTLRQKNGEKSRRAFSDMEYGRRLGCLRETMTALGMPAVLLTSMHNIVYFTGFLYCGFGRHFGCVITQDNCTTISANIDGGQPWRRSIGDNVIYTDWRKDNYWQAVAELVGQPSRLGVESDHLTRVAEKQLLDYLGHPELIDIAPDTMIQRMIKSSEEIAVIREGARIADIGGEAIRAAIETGTREIDVAIAGRDAMELAIAEAFPESELRDTWVWFQSGINTDGAHNPVTTRQLQAGDILSLNAFPMISGYYTALERTLFLGEPDKASLRLWQLNVEAHKLGISLIKPGRRCSEICKEINRFFTDEGLLKYRSFGYGHSFGILSHYYGREAGLEFREDIDTVLEPGMVVSMEPMLWVPEGEPGAGGYREHDILILTDDGGENITRFPIGPAFNIVPI